MNTFYICPIIDLTALLHLNAGTLCAGVKKKHENLSKQVKYLEWRTEISRMIYQYIVANQYSTVSALYIQYM